MQVRSFVYVLRSSEPSAMLSILWVQVRCNGRNQNGTADREGLPQVKPVLQALVLAERIYTDTTGKKIIAGTFNRVHIFRMPPPAKAIDKDGNEAVLMAAEQPLAPSAYISLTDVCDNTNLSLQFVSLSKNKVLFETTMQVSCKDRLATVEIVTLLPNFQKLRLEAGVYSFEIVCEGEVIGSHRVTVITAHD